MTNIIPNTSISKVKQMNGIGRFVCSTGLDGVPATILFHLDIEDVLKLRKVVNENEIAMAAITLDHALYFMNEDGDGHLSSWPDEFEHKKNYEVEDGNCLDTDEDGWFASEDTQLHVYGTRWVVAVAINNNTILYSEEIYFEDLN